jgi:hypothetical protein
LDMEIKISLDTVPPFYQTYVKHVQTMSLREALDFSLTKYEQIVGEIPESKGLYRYTEGKWTIKELLVHVLDAERIFGYRALRFARNDKTMLPGFEENDYVPNSAANDRSLKSIMTSMQLIRASTIDLFDTFSMEMLKRTGSANKTEISVETIGYVIAGHQLHHCSILQQRYLV